MDLRDARVLNRLTQIDVQELTGIYHSRICHLEKGYFKARPDEMKKLEKALGVPINWNIKRRR